MVIRIHDFDPVAVIRSPNDGDSVSKYSIHPDFGARILATAR